MIPLAPHVSILEDPGGELGLSDILTPAWQQRLLPSTQTALNFGRTDSAFWIKVDLDWAELSTDSRYVLEIGPPKPTREVTLFYLDDSSQLVDTIDMALRATAHHPNEIASLARGFASIVTPQQTRTIYLRVSSYRNFYLPLTLWQEAAYHAASTSSTLIMGTFYGIIGVIMLYNLFLFFGIRDPSYLLYIFYAGTNLALYVAMNEHLAYLGWTDTWIYGKFVGFVSSLMVIARLAFERQFLQIKNFNPTLDRLFSAGIALGVISLLLATLPENDRLFVAFNPFVVLPALLLSVYALADGIRQGVATARVYLLVSLPGVIGVFLGYATIGQGWFPYNWLTENGIVLGLTLETVLFSFALAHRFKLSEREREQALSLANYHQRQAIANLEQADKLKDRLLANVSHELRTPLFGIHGLVEMAEKIESSPQVAEYLQLIKHSGQRLTRLVNQLLDLSVIKIGDAKFDLQPVDITAMITVVKVICEKQLAQRPIQIETALAANLPLVLAEEDRLYQVLLNLSGNALKYTERGRVTISVQLSNSSGRERVLVSVQDTGIGIAAEDQEAIFESFEQIGSGDAKQKRRSGVGLGLAISKGLVEGHGGRLQVSSTPGQGSVFSFELDIAQTQGQTVARKTSPSLLAALDLPLAVDASEQQQILAAKPCEIESHAAKGDVKTVLVIDDDSLNRRILRQQLQQYRVVCVDGGEEALQLLEHEVPNLIILDLMMPGLHGYEVCEIIRQRHDATELPIIIVTARNQVDDLVKGFARGANDYLSKPFLTEELLSRVDNHLRLAELVAVHEENSRLQSELRQYMDAEKQLRLSQYQLQQMLEFTDQALLAFDEVGYVTYLTAPAEQLLGISAETARDQPVKNLLAGNASGHLLEIANHALAEQRVVAPQVIVLETANGVRSVQVRLEILQSDETVYIVLFDVEQSRALSEQTRTVSDSAELINLLNSAHEKIKGLGAQLDGLSPDILKQNQEVLGHLRSLDAALGDASAQLPQQSLSQRYREQIVLVMQLAMQCWEIGTGTGRVELAEQSRVWAVSVDDGRLRTRAMDRYLQLDTLPGRPRWRQVARTAYFVLSQSREMKWANSALLQELNERVSELIVLNRS